MVEVLNTTLRGVHVGDQHDKLGLHKERVSCSGRGPEGPSGFQSTDCAW